MKKSGSALVSTPEVAMYNANDLKSMKPSSSSTIDLDFEINNSIETVVLDVVGGNQSNVIRAISSAIVAPTQQIIRVADVENDYFINKYYQPDIQIKLSKKLLNFANTSIDVSDGLIADLEKMINSQKLSYKLHIHKIPISKQLSNLIKTKKINKSRTISNGDDYQILFTASPIKSRIIHSTSKILGTKITKIGKIGSGTKKSYIIDHKGKQTLLKNKGYLHQF